MADNILAKVLAVTISPSTVARSIVPVEKNGKKHTNLGVAARGQLHKETVFGKRTFNGEEAFHVRKPIESLETAKQIDKVVDESTRLLILKRINELGGFVKDKVPANTFFIADESTV